MDWTQALVVVLALAVMGWFALGVIGNIRRGSAVLKWMQAGLPRLGERTTLRWLGSSVVQLGIDKARPPFRKVELVVVLEPRDVPWLWLPARLGGRRDMLIIRGQLAHAPKFEYDLLAPGSWSERERLARAQGREWATEALGDMGFRAPDPTRSLARQAAPGALAAARQVRPIVWRLSSRREYPQLELHLPLPNPRQADAAEFFAAVRALAEQMAPRA